MRAHAVEDLQRRRSLLDRRLERHATRGDRREGVPQLQLQPRTGGWAREGCALVVCQADAAHRNVHGVIDVQPDDRRLVPARNDQRMVDGMTRSVGEINRTQKACNRNPGSGSSGRSRVYSTRRAVGGQSVRFLGRSRKNA